MNLGCKGPTICSIFPYSRTVCEDEQSSVGIRCNTQGDIVYLDHHNVNLTGTISSEIGKLTNLKQLVKIIKNNNLF